MSDSFPFDTSSIIQQIHCNVCGKILHYTSDELVSLLNHKWPRCCGEEMGFIPTAPQKSAKIRPAPVIAPEDAMLIDNTESANAMFGVPKLIMDLD